MFHVFLPASRGQIGNGEISILFRWFWMSGKFHGLRLNESGHVSVTLDVQMSHTIRRGPAGRFLGTVIWIMGFSTSPDLT